MRMVTPGLQQSLITDNRKRHPALSALIAAVALLAMVTVGAEAAEQKLTASDGASYDNFGTSVAISGDTAVVGSPLDRVSHDLDRRGSAYVFVRSGGVWTEQAKLIASDGAHDDYFGYSVAISGDTVVVGSPFHTVGANAGQGAAYVFVRTGSIWTEQAKLTANDGGAIDLFGWAVAIMSETVVVGAVGDTVHGRPMQGSAYVFSRVASTWNQEAKLTASDVPCCAVFGSSVAISADTVVVGAPGTWLPLKGSAYVFLLANGIWRQQAKLTASDGSWNDSFGYSVAISANTLVVGSPTADAGGDQNDNRGSAYVFLRNSGVWTERTKLTASDAARGDNFGQAVAVKGGIVVVGAPINDGFGSGYLFLRGRVVWTEQAKLTANDGPFSKFGYSVAISDIHTGALIVGSMLADIGSNQDQGAAYVYVQSSPAVEAAGDAEDMTEL